MKKFSIILLALAFGLVMTVPALAIHIGDERDPQGALGITGQYVLDGEKVDYDGDEAAWYDNDVDVNFTWNMGDVTVRWRAELDDTEGLEGAKNNAGIIDDLWVMYKASDALSFKFGEYFIGSSAVADDTTGGFNIQVMYGLDAVDLSLAIAKLDEDGASSSADADGDEDVERYVLGASFKEAGPMTKLNLTYVMEDDQVNEEGPSFMLLEAGLPIGPVSLGLEYGSFGGTDSGGADAEGNYMIFDIGLEELVGFDLGINYFVASDDLFGDWEEDYAPFQIIQDEVVIDSETSRDMTTIALTGSYGVNDNLKISAAYIMAETTEDGDEIGSEIDVVANYKIADNVTYKAAIGSFSDGDLGFGDITKYFNRLTFTF